MNRPGGAPAVLLGTARAARGSVRLRLTEFNAGVCTKTGQRWRWTGDKWVPAEFQEIDDLVRKRLEKRGMDIEAMYADFQLEIRIRPPRMLLEDLASAPALPEDQVSKLSKLGQLPKNWKNRNRHVKRRNASR